MTELFTANTTNCKIRDYESVLPKLNKVLNVQVCDARDDSFIFSCLAQN